MDGQFTQSGIIIDITEEERAGTPPFSTTFPGADFSEALEDEANVSIMRKKLTSNPKTFKKSGPRESLSALTEAQLKRAETMAEKVKIESQRLEYDNQWRAKEFELKQQEVNMRKEQLDSDERIRILQIEKDERVDKFKIEQEVKLQLELAKLKNTLL